MTYKHYLERVLGFGKIKIGILGEKGFETRKFFSYLMSVRLSEPPTSSKWACPIGSGHSSLEWAPSEGWPEATRTWSLKRTRLCLSEQCPVQQLFEFRFVHLGTNSNFLKGFFWLSYSLFIHLILLEHHLNQIGLGFYELVLMFGKCPRNSIFSKMRFLKRMM